jgi:TetR/AcrR family transcriptional regulator, regulator of cefoperazone and chloramphenicol sensitivity
VSSDDLTARARIRDAAIDLFAERGFGQATVRDIAQAAGVSSGLLRHHFGSKDGLREACDEYAMARTAELRAAMLQDGRLSDHTFMGTVQPVAMRLQRYLVRSMVDNPSPVVFERMVEAGEDWLAGTDIKTADPKAYAAVIVAMQIGMFLLRDQIGRSIGADLETPAGHLRMLRAAVDIFSQPLLTPEQTAQAQTALERLLTEKESE